MIDKQSPLPIYYQIQELIRKKIDKKEWQTGDVLPSERIFAEQYEVSRMTVRQAVTELVNEGLLRREKGRGTFVAEQKFTQTLQGLTSFTEDMKERGLKPSSRLISFNVREAAGKTARVLGLNDGEAVYEIQRIRLADDSPMAMETTYISKKLIPGLTKNIVQHSIYEYVEAELGLAIGYGEQSLEAALAMKKEAELLEIELNDPVLLISRITHLQDKTPFEYVKSAYRGDRYKFSIQMPRNEQK